MVDWMSATGWGTRRMNETTDGHDVGARSGLMAGTRVATAMGWRAVDALAEGDMVLTFDAGLQQITKVTRQVIWAGERACPGQFWPLTVPAGALGNRGDIYLLANQYVMVESDAGEDLFGDPFSLIVARALEGVNGIKAAPPVHGRAAIVLHFESEQVVFAESGVLYYCPSACGLLGQAVGKRVGPPYRALTAQDAEVLVWCIESERAAEHIWAQTSPVCDGAHAMA